MPLNINTDFFGSTDEIITDSKYSMGSFSLSSLTPTDFNVFDDDFLCD